MVFLCMTSFVIGIALTVVLKLHILWALIWGMFCFMGAAFSVGCELKAILTMMKNGMKTAMSVIKVFIFIGFITASWRASGTISFFVFWGIKLISPQWFVLSSFLMTCVISFLLGTSFGTVGTIGTVLMVMANSGGVNPLPVAGAIISGAYFGDRCAPTSSSLNLVCTLSGSELYESIKNLLKNSAFAFILTSLFYGAVSQLNPLTIKNNQMTAEIAKHYNLTPYVALPAIIILILPIFKLSIRKSMTISAACASLIAVLIQKQDILVVIKTLILGYVPNFDGWFAGLIKGGGLFSMLNSSAVVLLAATYSGIIQGAGIFKGLDQIIEKISKKIGIFSTTLAVALLTALFACNQTLCIMLTYQLMDKINKENKVLPMEICKNLANTAVLVSPLVPWNIAVSIPLGMMEVGWGAIPYSVYLIMVPIVNMGFSLAKKQKGSKLI